MLGHFVAAVATTTKSHTVLGSWQDLDAENLVLGDVIFLNTGNKLPADVRIIYCSDGGEVTFRR